MQVQFPSIDQTLLQGIFYACPNSKRIAVITHPYGPLGGNLYNHVCQKVSEICNGVGISALLINFRGIGLSKGRTSWTGKSEVEDVIAACSYATSLVQEPEIILIGYSYGSLISLKAAEEIQNVIGIISISYPASVIWALSLFNTNYFTTTLHSLPAVPKLFISTDRDTFTSPNSWISVIETVSDPKELVLLNGDHFWTTDESFGQLIDTLTDWIKRTFVA